MVYILNYWGLRDTSHFSAAELESNLKFYKLSLLCALCTKHYALYIMMLLARFACLVCKTSNSLKINPKYRIHILGLRLRSGKPFPHEELVLLK